MRISIIGIPGAGKTTLATLLGGMFKTMHISSGELARAHGFAGSKAEKAGKLDPNENKIRTLVKSAIGGSDMYILDGFPRMIDQIEAVQLPLDAVIHLKAKLGIAADRLFDRGRPDDTPEVINARIATYFRHTYPLVEYFDDKDLLIEIDANGSIAETMGKTVVQLSRKGVIEAKNMVDDLLSWEKKHD